MLDITNTAIMDVELRVALLGAERVVNAAGRLAAVLEISVLVHLHGVKTGLDAIELTNDAGQVMGLLLKLKTAARH